MIIFFTVRAGRKNADVSYNAFWMCLWSYAEISLGIIVSCTLSLPKFIEAKGKKMLLAVCGVTRHLSPPISSLPTLVRWLRHDSSSSSSSTSDVTIREKGNSAKEARLGTDLLSSTAGGREDVEICHPHERYTDGLVKPQRAHRVQCERAELPVMNNISGTWTSILWMVVKWIWRQA